MKRSEKFWEQVAFDIESSYKNGHPKEWKQDEIEIFIAKMHQRLKVKCQSNLSIAQILKCWNDNSSKVEIENLETLSYDTFRRIFITKKSPGSKSNRNKFAIYLGYNSYAHYINEKNINDDPKTEEEEQISFQEFIKENNLTDGLSRYFEQLQENFEDQIYQLLKRQNHRFQKSAEKFSSIGITFWAKALAENEMYDAYCIKNFNNQILSEADLKSCIKSIESLKKCTWNIFSYHLVCNAQIKPEQLATLNKKLKDLRENGTIEYIAEVYDTKSFIQHYISQVNPLLRDQIISANQKYNSDYEKRMEQYFYLEQVPFAIDENSELLINPLNHLSNKQEPKSANWELLELLKGESIEEKKSEWFFIISEFGFGKTSLFLNYHKLLQSININVLFVPIAQLSEKSFQNPDFFCRSILNLLYNKIYIKEEKQLDDSQQNTLDFFNTSDIFVELMVNSFKEMLKLRSDLVLLLDGLDENHIAYKKDGLKKIFDCIEYFKLKCFFSVREEFWNDKQGNFSKALKKELSEKIFLKEWDNKTINAYVEKYIEIRNPQKTEIDHLKSFTNIVSKGGYKKYYGDIPKRPLFLSMLTQDIIKGDFQKQNLSKLYENYLERKFEHDLVRAFEETDQLQSIELFEKEDYIKVLNKIFSVLTQVSGFMIINNESYEAVLLADITEDKITRLVDLLKEKIFSITEILQNSVLIPIKKRQLFNDFHLKFAHKSFQEYFTARYLFELLKYPGGAQREYDMFRYKFDNSVLLFLNGILENEKQQNISSFDKCIEMLLLIIQDQSLDIEAVGMKLKNQFTTRGITKKE